jgi:hypothetical protein
MSGNARAGVPPTRVFSEKRLQAVENKRCEKAKRPKRRKEVPSH